MPLHFKGLNALERRVDKCVSCEHRLGNLIVAFSVGNMANIKTGSDDAVIDDICADKQTLEGAEDWCSWFSEDN